MGRKALLVIALAVALIVALPSLAFANWVHKGKGELKENASITLSGELTLATGLGNIVCPTSLGATLTASSSAGDVNSFSVAEPSKCDLTGTLATVCGTHGLSKVEKTGTWAMTADETDVTLSSIDAHYYFAGCFISSIRVKGSGTGSLDKASAIGKITLSGTQILYNSIGEEAGSGELKGTLSASPAGTYGVKTGATVETRWTDGNSPLSEDGKLTLAGTFSFSGSEGGVSCPATVKLQLESSTVEEEEPEGEIESFSVAKPSECDVSGGYKSVCATNSITSVEQTGTATLTATKEDITVTGLSLDYKFSSCAITSLRIEGSPTLSVSSPESISSATFSGGGLQIYNAAGEKAGTASAGGSSSVSPSATYQLVETSKAHEEETHEEETEREETEETTATEDVSLQDEEGQLEAGAEVTLVSYNMATTFNESLNFPCEEVHLLGTVEGVGTSLSTISGSGSATGCHFEPSGAPMTVTNFEMSISLGIGMMELGFLYDMPAFGFNNCVLESTIPTEWAAETDEMYVSGSLLGTGEGCISGFEEIHGTYTVTTPNGNPVSLFP
jgi:hypothetical protein